MTNLPKTILITGATSGFGKETARIFIENGWQTIITGRRGNRLEDLTKELGKNCLPLCFDITDRNYVLGEHSIIAEGTAREILKSSKAIEHYFGKQFS